MKNPDFREAAGTKNASFDQRALTNHNKLLWSYPGANGVKTGYTRAAGRILVSSAERGGRHLIAVTICDPDDWNDHTKLLDYGFPHLKSIRSSALAKRWERCRSSAGRGKA